MVKNPIPDGGYRSAKNIQNILAVSLASLVYYHKKSTEVLHKALSKVTTAQLYRRVRYFLAQFKIHMNRRIRSSKKSQHLRKLCTRYLTLHQKEKLQRKLLRTAKETLAAAIAYPAIDDTWRRCRLFLCKSVPKREAAPSTPWPFAPAKKAEVSILFWNCNGGHKKEPKRTLISEMSRELKTDIIALVETKTPLAAAPEGFNLISFRNPMISKSQHTNRLTASGGICVGKTPPLTLQDAQIRYSQGT